MSAPALDSRRSIFARFLRFGLTAWGGPAAQIELIRRECVEQEGWVSEDAFRRTLAVYQVLPGPEATELCIYFGRLRRGRVGGLLAGLGFMLPGFVLMLAASILYVEAGLADSLDELFYGFAAAVGALIARALVRLGGAFLTDAWLWLLAIAAFALTLWTPVGFVIVLVAAGLLYELRSNAGRWLGNAASLSPGALVLVVVLAAGAPLTAELFAEGLKAGLLTFGGAFTVIPFLQESALANDWVSEGQFVDGLAIGGILPSPLVILGTFVGYLAGGLGGAVAMTVGIFLPAFVFPIFLHRQLVTVAENERLRPFLLGVAAAVVGLIAAVGVEIVETGVVDVYTAALAIGAFGVLMRWHGKLTIVAVMLGCGALGALVQVAGLA
jgi:chromate transporter